MKSLFTISTLLISMFSINTFVSTPQNNDFETFLSNFEQTEFPYQITKENLREIKIKQEQVISSEFVEFVPDIKYAAMGRLGYTSYHFEKLLVKNEKFIAVIISNHTGQMPFKGYKLITYDNTGKLIDDEYLANQSYTSRKTITISKDLKIKTKVEEFKIKKRQEKRHPSYEEVTSDKKRRVVKTKYENHKITSEGKIEEI